MYLDIIYVGNRLLLFISFDNTVCYNNSKW